MNTNLIVFIGAHLFPCEARQIKALPEVVPGARVVVPLVRREQPGVDADLYHKHFCRYVYVHIIISILHSFIDKMSVSETSCFQNDQQNIKCATFDDSIIVVLEPGQNRTQNCCFTHKFTEP